MSVRARWWAFAAVVIVVRTAALALSVPESRPLTGDEPIYEKLAHSLLEGRGYSRDGAPYVQKPPGWPGVLAALHLAFGENLRAFVAVQGLFDAATALLSAWTATRVFGSPAAGGIAFLLVALWPPFLRESRFLQTEPMYTAGLAAMLATFTAFAIRPRWRVALAFGLATACAIMARPTGLVPAGGLVVGWLLVRRRRAWPDALKLAAFALGLMLVLGPWGLRNQRVFGQFIPTGVGAGDLFWIGATPETDGRWDHAFWEARKRELFAAESVRLGRPLDAIAEDRVLMREGLRHWREDPGGSAWRSVKRLYRLVLVPVRGDDRPILRGAFLVVLLGLYALALPRAIAGFRSRDPEGAVPAAMFVSLALTIVASTVFLTNSRFFEPMRPFLFVLAAGTLARRRR